MDETGAVPRGPFRLRLAVQNKPLTVPLAVRAVMGRRQVHLVVDDRHMVGGHADLDHLQHIGGVEDAVADLGRLDYAVARRQPELRPLILVNQIDPAGMTEYQLKADLVKMHHVRHRSALRNADMGGDEGAAQTPRREVAIMHTRPPDDPWRAFRQTADDEAGRRLHRRQVFAGRRDFNPHAGRRGQRAHPTCESRVVGQYSDCPRRLLRPALKPQAQPVAGDDGDGGVVGGKDHLQAEAEILKEGQVLMQVLRR